MNKTIDLGRKFDDLAPIANSSSSDYRDKVHYPDLHISDVDDPRLLDLPDKGECLIKYKVTHRTHSEHDQNGKKERRCSLTLEIHSIEPPPGKSKKNGDYDGGARKAFADYFKDK